MAVFPGFHRIGLSSPHQPSVDKICMPGKGAALCDSDHRDWVLVRAIMLSFSACPKRDFYKGIPINYLIVSPLSSEDIILHILLIAINYSMIIKKSLC